MIEFKLPDLGEGIAEAEIVSWLVSEGDLVEEHQAMLEVETDKAIVPVPAPVSGRVVRLHGPAGATIKVGDVLVSLEPAELSTVSADSASGQALAEQNGNGSPERTVGSAPTGDELGNGRASSSATASAERAERLGTAPPRRANLPGDVDAARESEQDAGSVVGRLERSAAEPGERPEVLATPAVRRLARQLGVELEHITGTGVARRITEADVRAHAHRLREPTVAQPAAPAPVAASAKPATLGVSSVGVTGTLSDSEYGPVEKRPLRGVRKAIAHHLSKAARTVVPVTNFDDADVTELVRIRAKEEKAARAHGVRLTYLPFIIKAVIQALKQYPLLNATLEDESGEIHVKRYYNIGIAVDTPDGLMVPNIKNADKKSMLEIAAEVSRLAQAANERTVTLEELRGGTFTITNFGTIGGTHATPIVNYPETAILGVGRIKDRVVPVDGQIAIRKMVALSLTFDHRLIDGGDAARFLNSVIQHIEDPDLILIKSIS